MARTSPRVGLKMKREGGVWELSVQVKKTRFFYFDDAEGIRES
jgi:hypothetical protein